MKSVSMLSAYLDPDRMPGPGGVMTQPFVLSNRYGALIRGLLQRPAGADADCPVIVAAAGLGVTMRRTMLFATFLLANGFTVVRYDPTHAAGLSDGDFRDVTLTRVQDDLVDVLSWAKTQAGGGQVATLAASLTGRAAIRAAAQDPGLMTMMGSVACVTNVRATVTAVNSADRIGQWLSGQVTDRLATTELFDDEIRWNAYATLAEDGWDTLASTERELRCAAGVRFVNLHGENDPWVRTEDVRAAFAQAADARLIVLGSAVHELNFATARVALGILTHEFISRMRPGCEPGPEPEFGHFVGLNKVERKLQGRLLSLATPSNR
jgi:dienelactone hydrolase